VEILSDKKQSDTWRSGELRFYFTPADPDEFIFIIWALNKEFTGYLKSKCRASGYKECAGVSR
jgi:hypothetical protein